MNLKLIFRAPRYNRFSIEKVFNSLVPHYPQYLKVDRFYVKSPGGSILPILRNMYYRGSRADIYHITGDVHYMVFVYPRKRTVLTIHDCVFMNNGSFIKKKIMQFLWLQLPVRLAETVTTISEKSKNDIVKYTNCSPDKIRIIPDPISDDFKYVPKIFNDRSPRVLQIGTGPNKNIERIIAATKEIDCELVIIGRLNSHQKEMLVNGNRKYINLQELTDREIVEQYNSADIVLFVSLAEGFGLPPLEAQAVGRVVVASNIEPILSVTGNAACFVDPYSIDSIRDAILDVCKNEQYRNSLIEKGLENVKQYNSSYIVKQYCQIYNSIN